MPLRYPLLALVFVIGCAGNVEVNVRVTTDLVPGVEFQLVRAEVDGQGWDVFALSMDDFTMGKSVHNFAELAPASDRLVSVQLLTADRTVVAERSALIDNRSDGVVNLAISRSCANVSCNSNETCVGGSCVSPTCVTGAEESCSSATCATALDCTDSDSSCLNTTCLAGVCLNLPTDSCGANDYCDPVSGCTPWPIPLCDSDCDDGNPCTENICAGECASRELRDGTLCPAGICQDGGCVAANCDNNTLDGDETDEDCGGSCTPCREDERCVGPTDCRTGICTDQQCQAPSCSDSVLNGDETDVDCGGDCEPCVEGSLCDTDDDCVSDNCGNDDVCISSTCEDGEQNGSELGIDCGGSCQPCGSCATQTELEADECMLLRNLYDSIGGIQTGLNWFVGQDPCDWTGIDCTGDEVEAISITSSTLQGTLPDDLSILDELSSFAISGAPSLTGAIPSRWPSSINSIDIQGTGIDSIPNPLSLSSLESLILRENKISSGLPTISASDLQVLDISDNDITGSFPTAFLSLNSLRQLRASGNSIGGELPSNIAELDDLRILDLSNNQFTGTIPELSELGLDEIDLSENQFSGQLPSELPLGLDTFRLNDNNLQGVVPEEFRFVITLTLSGNGCFTTEDSSLSDVLTSKDPNWADGC